jgi:hypothetical protein
LIVVTAAPGPGTLTLAWQPEMDDWAEAFEATRRARGLWRKVAVIVAGGVVAGVVGLATGNGALVVAGIGAIAATLYGLGPGQRMAVRSFWRRLPALQQPARATVGLGQGVAVSTPEASAWYRVFVLRLAGRGRAYLLLAKRGLPSPDQLPTLRELLAAATSSAPGPRSA